MFLLRSSCLVFDQIGAVVKINTACEPWLINLEFEFSALFTGLVSFVCSESVWRLWRKFSYCALDRIYTILCIWG